MHAKDRYVPTIVPNAPTINPRKTCQPESLSILSRLGATLEEDSRASTTPIGIKLSQTISYARLAVGNNPAVDNALVVAIAKMGAETREPNLLLSSKCCPIAAAPVKTANTPSVDAITDARVLHRCAQRATGVLVIALNRARRSLRGVARAHAHPAAVRTGTLDGTISRGGEH